MCVCVWEGGGHILRVMSTLVHFTVHASSVLYMHLLSLNMSGMFVAST